jgi:hypothetical protein
VLTYVLTYVLTNMLVYVLTNVLTYVLTYVLFAGGGRRWLSRGCTSTHPAGPPCHMGSRCGDQVNLLLLKLCMLLTLASAWSAHALWVHPPFYSLPYRRKKAGNPIDFGAFFSSVASRSPLGPSQQSAYGQLPSRFC